MSAETKRAALAKLHAIRNKIGYPSVGAIIRPFASSARISKATSAALPRSSLRVSSARSANRSITTSGA